MLGWVALFLLQASGAAPDGLAPLARYVDHCWTTDLGAGATDRHCFRRILGGGHVRDTHVVFQAGREVYSGETIYSVEAGQITFTYFNSLGGVGRGVARSEGGTLRFDLDMRARPDDASANFKTVWTPTARGYEARTGDEVRTFRLDDGASGAVK